MREDKDDSAKWLIEHHGDAILRMGGIRGFSSWRTAQAERAHPKQLPDGLLEVFFPDQPAPDLFIIEVATYPERRAEEQAIRDAALVWLDRDVLPEIVTLVLHPKGQLRVSGQWQLASRHGLTRLTGMWTVVEMWTLSAEDLLATNDVGIIPWVPLARTTLAPEELLRQCRDRIDRQARPEEQANLLAVTQVMTSLRYNDQSLLSIFGGKIMLVVESPLMKEILEENSRDVSQSLLVKNLRAKFPELPPEIVAKVQAIQDVERLSQLHIQVIVCPDLDSFKARLAE